MTLVFIMQACGKRSEVSEKVFSCSMCNFSSNYLYSLKRHMATHCSYNLSTSLPSDQQPPPSSIDLIKEPTLICMQKPYRSSNLSFHQWVQTPGNIYIGGNAKKVLPSRVQRGLCVDLHTPQYIMRSTPSLQCNFHPDPNLTKLKDSNKLICEECGLKIQKEVLLETK